MKYFKRVIAWLVFAGLVFGAYKAATAFTNPWAAAMKSPVLSNLPAMPDGCSKAAGCL